jgi:type III secretion protein T
MTAPTDYTIFFTQLFEFSHTSALSIFIITLFRLAPIVVLAPFLGAKLPPMPKVGLLIALSVIFIPHVAMTAQTSFAYTPMFVVYAIKEIFIGFVLSFLINIPFQFAQTAGALIDFLRGASSLQVSDPFSNAQTSPIGNLYNYVLIAAFYTMGGPFYFFDSVVASYTLIPADAMINPLFFSPGQPFWQTIIALTTKVVALSIQLSAPSLLAIMMTEVFLGIANRLAPQVQITFLGMSVKSLLGLTLLCLGWMFILQQVEKQTILWLKEIDKLLLLIPRGS